MAARPIVLGCALLPHGPLPGPGHSGIVCNASVFQHHVTSTNNPVSVLTVCVRGEPCHSHHRHVPTSAEEARRQRGPGSGHRCFLLSTGAATHL